MRLNKIVSSPSKRLGVFLVSFCLGILIGPLFLNLPSEPILFLLFGLIACACFLTQAHTRFVLFVSVCFFFGIFRYQQSELPSAVVTIADRVGQSIRLSGEVTSQVEERLGTQRTILSNVRVADESVSGKLLVSFALYPTIAYGDLVTFNCKPEIPEPIEGFRYDRQLHAQGVFATCSFPQYVFVTHSSSDTVIAKILFVKEWSIKQLQMILPEPHAGFVSGLLFGGSSSLSKETKETFSRTGTSHILAASGFNVSLFSVVLLSMLLSSPLGRKRGLIVTSIFLLAYVFVAGATASVVRATIMALLIVVQGWVSRRALMLNVVLLTLAVMLLFNPRLLLDDVGFQLSFVATCAILFVVPKYKHALSFFPSAFGVRDALTCSLVATIFTLPISLWHFGQLSLVAPFVNMLVLPFVPFLMAGALIALAVSAISITFAQFIALPVWTISFVMLKIISAFSAFAFASLSVGSSHMFAIVSSVSLLGVWFFSISSKVEE